MSTVSPAWLDPDAHTAIERLQQHRRRMYTLKGREAEDAREQLRSHAVDLANAILKQNPELIIPNDKLDELLAGGAS